MVRGLDHLSIARWGRCFVGRLSLWSRLAGIFAGACVSGDLVLPTLRFLQVKGRKIVSSVVNRPHRLFEGRVESVYLTRIVRLWTADGVGENFHETVSLSC